jgi:hypothetical protein
MKTLFNYSNYGNDLKITRKDANFCSGSGDMGENVKQVMSKPYIKKQLTNINPEKLIKELREYGAWDDTELTNHPENLKRWVWISCCDISERL